MLFVEFENAWGGWLGTKYNLMVNSGASANELTMLALAHLIGEVEIIVPPLTWISDISSVLFANHKLVFVDVNFNNLSFDLDKLKDALCTGLPTKDETSETTVRNLYCLFPYIYDTLQL